MRKTRTLLLGTVFAAAVGALPVVISARPALDEVVTRVTGRGHYLIAGSLDVQFSLAAFRHGDGEATGRFHHRTNDGLGSVDFYGTVTCLEVDAEQGRAWIGGVITANLSTSPNFTAAVHQPGHDIWFRVLDGDANAGQLDEDAEQQDRTTFVGFEGTIPSSAVYCATRPWPAANARTWPVTEGKITVRVEDR